MIAWIGTIASVIGSFLIAFGIIPAGYLCFIVGSTCWLCLGLYRRDRPMVVLNMFFFAANLIGIIRL